MRLDTLARPVALLSLDLVTYGFPSPTGVAGVPAIPGAAVTSNITYATPVINTIMTTGTLPYYIIPEDGIYDIHADLVITVTTSGSLTLQITNTNTGYPIALASYISCRLLVTNTTTATVASGPVYLAAGIPILVQAGTSIALSSLGTLSTSSQFNIVQLVNFLVPVLDATPKVITTGNTGPQPILSANLVTAVQPDAPTAPIF